jgi:hypothetical protein
MQHFYTKDYDGEIVVTSSSWRDAHKEENRVWTPKSIINEPDNPTAHIIGNGPSRKNFDLKLLNGQTGGEEGIRSVGQSYGCNLLYKDFAPTFLFVFDKTMIAEIADTDYGEDNIVYSSAKNILKHPGNFHLYPHHYNAMVGNLACHLACADGHKRLFLLGFDWYVDGTENIYHDTHQRYATILEQNIESANNKLTSTLERLVAMYSEVQFYRVADTSAGAFPDEFNWYSNWKQIEYRQYYAMASLGASHKN